MKLKPLEFLEEDRLKLEWIVQKGRDWRERERAQSILLLGAGWAVNEVAKHQSVRLYTIYERRQRWLEGGLASLPDQARCGAPAKLTAEHLAWVKGWATEEALTTPELLIKLKEVCGVVVHRNTLSLALKKMNFVWKRTRHSLKKNETNRNSGKQP
jgi:transposase